MHDNGQNTTTSPIEPTVGRVVLFTLSDGKTIRPADVVGVQSRNLVELSVKLGPGDRSDGQTHLVLPNCQYDDRPDQPGTWRWMSYQKGQAAKERAEVETQLRAAQPHFKPAPDSPVAPSASSYRQLTSHKVNGCNEKITIDVVDAPGQGGANHLYRISGYDPAWNASWPLTAAHNRATTEILFQNGPIGDSGTNGITHEVLLAILEDRLAGFQQGKWASAENAEALEYIRGARAALFLRTKGRVARGVEGTHAV